MILGAKVRLFLAVVGLALALTLPVEINAAETEPCSWDPEARGCYKSVNGENIQCEGLEPGCGCLYSRVWTGS